MKMGIAALILLTSIITILIIFNTSLNNTSTEIIENLNNAREYINSGEYENAINEYNKAADKWNKREKFYGLLIESAKLNEIKSAFIQGKLLYSEGRTDEFIINKGTLIFLLENLASENKLNYETIF